MPILGEPMFVYMAGNAKTGWDTNSRGTAIVDLCASGTEAAAAADKSAFFFEPICIIRCTRRCWPMSSGPCVGGQHDGTLQEQG